MKQQYIVPFVDNSLGVLKTMANIEALTGTPFRKEDNITLSSITGVIGLTGPNVKGNMMLSFDELPILTIIHNMLGEEFTEICEEVVDAVGELTNIISGGVKRDLSEMGLVTEMSSPIVVVGEGLEITQITDAPITVIPFDTPTGKFYVEANLGDGAG